MKKEILLPVLIIFLGFIFVVINIIVFFSKGNAWAINKKLKIGAMILSLTTIIGCGGSHTDNDTTCYKTRRSDNYDSINKINQKRDSIHNAEKQKQIDDSIANVNGKKQKVSIVKIKHSNKNPVRPVCYGAPANTCYTQVAPKKDVKPDSI
jgi:hypothetical protein